MILVSSGEERYLGGVFILKYPSLVDFIQSERFHELRRCLTIISLPRVHAVTRRKCTANVHDQRFHLKYTLSTFLFIFINFIIFPAQRSWKWKRGEIESTAN
jgi:hypothetical protein